MEWGHNHFDQVDFQIDSLLLAKAGNEPLIG